MINVWEVCKNEEYFMQESHGLYSSLEVAKKHFPEYTVELVQYREESGELNMIILVKPELAQSAREAYGPSNSPNYGYWWYHIKGDYGYDACIGIFKREVQDDNT